VFTLKHQVDSLANGDTRQKKANAFMAKWMGFVLRARQQELEELAIARNELSKLRLCLRDKESVSFVRKYEHVYASAIINKVFL
jgi:hypothetical protein